MDFTLPEKDFYTIKELSKRWNCGVSDIEHLIYEQGYLRLSIRLGKISIASFPFSLIGGHTLNNNYDYYSFVSLSETNEIIYGDGPPDQYTSNMTFIYIDKEFIASNKNIRKSFFAESIVNKEMGLWEKKDQIGQDSLTILSSAETFKAQKLDFFAEQEKDPEYKIDDKENVVRKYSALAFFDCNDGVITKHELDRFEAIYINKTTHQKINDLNSTATKTLQKLVLGMAIEKYKYDPTAKRNTATGENSGSITADLQKYPELTLDNQTIKTALDRAYKELKPEIKNKS